MDRKVLRLKLKGYSEQQILKTDFSPIGQILLKISFLKGKNNSFWEN